MVDNGERVLEDIKKKYKVKHVYDDPKLFRDVESACDFDNIFTLVSLHKTSDILPDMSEDQKLDYIKELREDFNRYEAY